MHATASHRHHVLKPLRASFALVAVVARPLERGPELLVDGLAQPSVAALHLSEGNVLCFVNEALAEFTLARPAALSGNYSSSSGSGSFYLTATPHRVVLAPSGSGWCSLHQQPPSCKAVCK